MGIKQYSENAMKQTFNENFEAINVYRKPYYAI
jgi:hypothetical protein